MELSTLTPKRAQIWGLDLIVAVLIFSFALTFFYFYALNDRDSTKETLELLQHHGKIITGSILSEGEPTNWNQTTVQEIGILSNGKINETKLAQFNSLATTSYAQSKQLFNTIYDYYFFLDTNITINTTEIEGIGKPGTTKNNINAKNLIKISRVTIYQNKPVGATLYIWEQ